MSSASLCMFAFRRSRKAALAALVFTAIASFAHADSIPVVNGSFEASTAPTQIYSSYCTSCPTLPGWTSSGFVYLEPSGGGWNTAGVIPTSPDGGNFLALDGDQNFPGSISQVINGLTPGVATTVTFEMSGANYYTLPDTLTTDQLEVSLGGESQLTPVLGPGSDPKAWQTYSLTFMPTSASETLSFLAIGTPVGDPPLVLLDGVSISDATGSPVPEPASLSLLTTGLIGVGGLLRSRFSKRNQA